LKPRNNCLDASAFKSHPLHNFAARGEKTKFIDFLVVFGVVELAKKDEIWTGLMVYDRRILLSVYQEMAKKTCSEKELKKDLGNYLNRFRSLKELIPSVNLVQCVYYANMLIAYTKHCSRRSNEFKQETVIVPDGIVRNALKRDEEYYRKFILKHLKKEFAYHESIVNPAAQVFYAGAEMKYIILPYAFLWIWTAIESYLEGRIRSRVFRDDDSILEFMKKASDDIPQSWSDRKGKIQPWEYATEFDEIVDQYLTFPYHGFEGKVRNVYKQCFNVDIMKFSQIGELIKLRKTRHEIVHQGITILGHYTSLVDYKKAKKLANIALLLGEFIEEETSKTDTTKADRR
jgi:hypothetical protein